MPKKSAFIVFEGLDGSGLTTHSRALEEWLQRQGYSVIWQDEPTPGVIGHLIREIMQSDVRIQGRQDLLALLFAADRIWHIKQPREDRDDKKRVGIERALREGNIVICNRYLLSSLAYQSGPPPQSRAKNLDPTEHLQAGSLDMDWIDTINHPQNGEKVILDPDLVIFLDVAPEKSLERIRRTRGEFQVYEDYPSLSEVYKNFNKAMTKYSHWRIVRVKGFLGNQKPRSKYSVQREIQQKVIEFVLKDEKRTSSKSREKSKDFSLEDAIDLNGAQSRRKV